MENRHIEIVIRPSFPQELEEEVHLILPYVLPSYCLHDNHDDQLEIKDPVENLYLEEAA